MKLLPLAALLPGLAFSADLKPDATTEIPASAMRPVVVSTKGKPFAQAVAKAELPAGYSLKLAAAAPLVLHPIMGCLDDRGRLFVGDATGMNWNKKQLEANPPNRVLMLEDSDGNGVYDKSTVFADKMTFPQGACWLAGSLYVCSPPGLWKLTDTNGDGVADERMMIVGGFEYTGNAADVHGPFLHPTNGRLYWCHGRKGHKVTDKEGNVVHEGLASGIWSCQPDGSDVQWHSLGCGDNPVEVDFTPGGDVIGVQNLYYSNPRGDTLVHWLKSGVYERADQMKAIVSLPRTLDTMPVMYNFGHVAVSGSTFWRAAPMGGLQFMVTHFNTQRVVRMELVPEGSTYKATENEFLKLESPDVHFTDVMEDPRDGSLLVIDTGGWFRIGCPASLMAKPDIAGAIYRVKPPAGGSKQASVAASLAGKAAAEVTETEIVGLLKSKDPFAQRRGCDSIQDTHSTSDPVREALMKLLALPLDPALEHAAISAGMVMWVGLDEVREAENKPLLFRRLMRIHDQEEQEDAAGGNLLMGIAAKHMDSQDADLARIARNIVIQHPDADEWTTPSLVEWLQASTLTPQRLEALEVYCGALAGRPETNKLIGQMLRHKNAGVRATALRVLADQKEGKADAAWLEAVDGLFADGVTPLLLDAIKKLKSSRFDGRLQTLANDAGQPQSLRLKALDAMSVRKISGETFAMMLGVLTRPESSAAARIQAATMLARSSQGPDEQLALAKALSTVGPVELKELLTLFRACKDNELVRTMAVELAKNPSLISQQESAYRTALADKPADIFESIVLPAYRRAGEVVEAKKRQLAPLADKVASTGTAKAGQAVFESGRGTCIACHQIGDKGRNIGPNLSHIGAIRTERDLLESILFPSNTLARDYEAHIFELSSGETITGVIRSHTAEGLLVADIAGQEKNIPHDRLVSDTQLTTSLMPLGLDQTLPEQDLLDLVAWLRSLK